LSFIPYFLSLFTNDVDNEFGSGFVVAATDTQGLKVTHTMLYADDLTLTANDPAQKILKRLESFAARKGLALSVQKF
jgi:hypothetical protein